MRENTCPPPFPASACCCKTWTEHTAQHLESEGPTGSLGRDTDCKAPAMWGRIYRFFPSGTARLNPRNPSPRSASPLGRQRGLPAKPGVKSRKASSEKLRGNRGNPLGTSLPVPWFSLPHTPGLTAAATASSKRRLQPELFLSVLPVLGPDMTVLEASGSRPDRKREIQGREPESTGKTMNQEELEKATP